jgi:hypothetical protein
MRPTGIQRSVRTGSLAAILLGASFTGDHFLNKIIGVFATVGILNWCLNKLVKVKILAQPRDNGAELRK